MSGDVTSQGAEAWCNDHWIGVCELLFGLPLFERARACTVYDVPEDGDVTSQGADEVLEIKNVFKLAVCKEHARGDGCMH